MTARRAVEINGIPGDMPTLDDVLRPDEITWRPAFGVTKRSTNLNGADRTGCVHDTITGLQDARPKNKHFLKPIKQEIVMVV